MANSARKVMINNRMSIDFGFPQENLEESKADKEKISAFIDHLNKTLDFVLIVEMFDESLVYLRRMLNWTTKDIIYVKKNSKPWLQREKVPRFVHRDKYPESTHFLVNIFQSVDVALYRHFRDLFEKRLRSESQNFHLEVAEFRTVNKMAADYCRSVRDVQDFNVKSLTIPAGNLTSEVTVSKLDCHLITISEEDLTKKAQDYQKLKLLLQ